MNLNVNNVETEREKTFQFAEDNNISEEEINNVYNEIYEQLPSDLSENAKELRALRKTRGALRRIANSNVNYIDGFIVMRFKNNDYEANAWQKVHNFIQQHGIDEAKARNMVNDNGDYLHCSLTTQFDNQMGKKIDKSNVRGSAIGLFRNDDSIDMRFLTISKFIVNKTIPICREISVNVKDAQSPGKVFINKSQYYLNNVRYTTMSHYYSSEDFQSYIDMIEDECGDIFISLKSEIDDFAHEKQADRFNFVASLCTVNRIGAPLDNGNVPIELELDDDLITVWTPDYIFKDLTIEEGIVGLAFIHTYIKQDNTVGYDIGGFLPLSEDG